MAGRKRDSNVYAMYKGDRNVTDGTLDEISRKTGLAVHTLQMYKSPSGQRRGYTFLKLGGKDNETELC